MSWTAHYFDPRLNRVAVSRVFASKEDALRQACDLMLRKCVVRFVTGPNEERFDAVAITKWCKGHRTALKPQLATACIRGTPRRPIQIQKQG